MPLPLSTSRLSAPDRQIRRHIGMIGLAAFTFSALAFTGSSHAADVSVNDSLAAHAADICDPQQKIDKEKLATHLLQSHPVSALALVDGTQSAPLTSRRELLQWLLVKNQGTAAQPCNGGDACQIESIRNELGALLSGTEPQFRPSQTVDPVTFMKQTGNDPVICTGAPFAPPATVAKAATAAKTSGPQDWREKLIINGNPDQLSIDKSDKAAFSSMDKANIALSNDDVAGSRTRDVVVFAGYSLFKSEPNEKNRIFQIVPYVGTRQNSSTNTGNGSTVTTRTVNTGVLGSLHIGREDSKDSDNFNARPDYLYDSTDGSRLFSLNFQYTPVRENLLNDFIKLPIDASIKPIFIVQNRNGMYVNKGNGTSPTLHQNFLRVGGQAGASIISNNANIPLDFTGTYTGLHDMRGGAGIHYWKAALTYALNQNIGLTMSYSHGLLPDSGDPEKKWNIGLGAKF